MRRRMANGSLWGAFGPASDGDLIVTVIDPRSRQSTHLRLDEEERAWLRQQLEEIDAETADA